MLHEMINIKDRILFCLADVRSAYLIRIVTSRGMCHDTWLNDPFDAALVFMGYNLLVADGGNECRIYLHQIHLDTGVQYRIAEAVFNDGDSIVIEPDCKLKDVAADALGRIEALPMPIEFKYSLVSEEEAEYNDYVERAGATYMSYTLH